MATNVFGSAYVMPVIDTFENIRQCLGATSVCLPDDQDLEEAVPKPNKAKAFRQQEAGKFSMLRRRMPRRVFNLDEEPSQYAHTPRRNKNRYSASRKDRHVPVPRPYNEVVQVHEELALGLDALFGGSSRAESSWAAVRKHFDRLSHNKLQPPARAWFRDEKETRKTYPEWLTAKGLQAVLSKQRAEKRSISGEADRRLM